MPIERKAKGKDGIERTTWIVHFTDMTGKRTSKTFHQKAKALGFEKRTKEDAKLSKKPRITKSQVTIREAVEKFIEDSEIGRDGNAPWRSATIFNHKNMAKRLYRFLPEGTPLKTITVGSLKVLRAEIQQDDMAESSKVSLWTMLKSVLSYMVTEEIIDTNPAQTLHLRASKVVEFKEDEFDVFTKDEVKAIVSTAMSLREHTHSQIRETYGRIWFLPALLFETGLRISEAQALDWDAINLADRQLTVRQTFNRKQEVDKVKAAASRRVLSLSTAMTEVLRDMKWRATSNWVFATGDGKPLQYRNTLRWWHRLLEYAAVREAGFHAARHYYASILIEQGVDPKVLTTNLGHTDVAFTMNVYGHLFDDRDTRAKKLEIADNMSVLTAA